MSNFWSWYIILLVVSNIVGCCILLYATRRNDPNKKANETLDHDFDGIQELNNPLPRWWLWLFAISIVYSIIYLILYPGLGNYKGYLNWTSTKQWEEEVAEAKRQYEPLFAKYAKVPIPELSKDIKANGIGQRIFINNCSTCHGSDAKGAIGFPDLTNGYWTYGGKPQDIITSIKQGRTAIMPGMGPMLGGDAGVTNMANYVYKLSNIEHDTASATKAEPMFKTVCAACHGPEGKGNPILGAPDITKGIFLYGQGLSQVKETIANGRKGEMPAHKELLSDEQIHLVAAYIFGLNMAAEN